MRFTIGPITAVRPDDLVLLDISFENLVLELRAAGPMIVRGNAHREAYLVVELPAQAIAEEAFYFDKLEPPQPAFPTWPTARTILAGPSRLVFRVPPEITEIRFSLEGILQVLPRCPLVVARAARTDIGAGEGIRPARPGDLETFIEAPYRLLLSPDQCAAWLHAAKPVTHGDRTELWHTRLTPRRPPQGGRAAGPTPDCPVLPDPSAAPAIRVIWSWDCEAGGAGGLVSPQCPPLTSDPGQITRRPGDPVPMPTSLWPAARCQLAWLTGSHNVDIPGAPGDPTLAAPLAAKQVMLSSLGAWLDLHGEWRESSPVARFEHRATMGREQFTRVDLRGYFYPLGHRATLVLLTERRLRPDFLGVPQMAYLVQEMYIEAAERTREYLPDESPHRGRKLPYRSITLLTERTPRIPSADLTGESAFWIRIGGRDFLFACEGVDGDGNVVRWSMPLAFVCQNHQVQHYDKVQRDFTAERRKRPLDGQKLAYVDERRPNASQPAGRTSMFTRTFTFGAMPPPAPGPGQRRPPFAPVMDAAEVQIPALQHLTRQGSPVQEIQYFEDYLEHGIDRMPAGAFARFPAPPGLDMAPERAGGLMNLNPTMQGLSRDLGPLGELPRLGPQGLPAGAPDIAKLLGKSKLLGGIALANIVDLPDWRSVAPSTPGAPALPKIPGLTVTYDDPRDPKVVTASLKFEPKLKDLQLGVLEFFARESPPDAGGGREARMELHAEVQVRRDGTPPTTLVRGTLTNFSIRIAESIDLRFRSFDFLVRGGEKPDVNVGLKNVTFIGPLAFVDDLAKLIDTSGFEDPPSLEVTPRGLRLGYSLSLPPVRIGIFTLANISLGASLHLPLFGDEPFTLGFNFCTRERPFTVGVAPFAGGGFFGIVLGAGGVKEIEASLEFGGSLSLDIGVASGGVSVMAGVYFKLERTPQGDKAALTGYVRANGCLSVLGLVRLSVEFYLGLTVELKHAGRPMVVHGEARLVVKVEVLFFSASVTLTVKRSFDGPDPTFAQSMPLDAWKSYALAFA